MKIMDKKTIKLLQQLQEKHERFIHIRIYADKSGGLYMDNCVFDFENKKELKKLLKEHIKN